MGEEGSALGDGARSISRTRTMRKGLVTVWEAVGSSGFADRIGLLQDLVAHFG
jgi:hypothetical protein